MTAFVGCDLELAELKELARLNVADEKVTAADEREDFASQLSHALSIPPPRASAWDVRFSKNKKLILILSGSLSSWIERNILHSTGFVGRVHLDLTLDASNPTE